MLGLVGRRSLSRGGGAVLRPGWLWDSLGGSESPQTADRPLGAAPVCHCRKNHRRYSVLPPTHPSITLQGKGASSQHQEAPPTLQRYLTEEVAEVKRRRFSVKMMSAASSRAETAVRVTKRKRPESRRRKRLQPVLR